MQVDVKPSPIHGKGVFARKAFRKNERIGRYAARRTDQDGMHVLWIEGDGAWQGYQGYGRLRFLNHSKNGNSEFRGLDLYAITTIRPGEEITFDYGEEWADVD